MTDKAKIDKDKLFTFKYMEVEYLHGLDENLIKIKDTYLGGKVYLTIPEAKAIAKHILKICKNDN